MRRIGGHIPQGLPLLTLPAVSLTERLWSGALGIALMSFTETSAAGCAFARSDEPSLQPNRELLATGLANVGGAFAGVMPAGGRDQPDGCQSFGRSTLTIFRTRDHRHDVMPMVLLAPVIALMPQATLVAVVIVYSAGLIKPVEFREILNVRSTEFRWALVASPAWGL